MPQSYETVELFFRNVDAHAVFLARVTARLVEWAIDARQAPPPDPVTEAYAARMRYAAVVLSGQPEAIAKARALLPALAVVANAAGLLDEEGLIHVSDAHILATIDDDFIDLNTDYIPAP